MKKILFILCCFLAILPPVNAGNKGMAGIAFSDIATNGAINTANRIKINFPCAAQKFEFLTEKADLSPEMVKALDDKIAETDRYIEKKPQDIKTGLIAKMLFLAAKDKIQDAIDCAEKVVIIDPQEGMAWCMKAELLLALGKLKDAEWAADKAIGTNKGLANALVMKSLILDIKNDFEGALALYNKALLLEPDKMKALIHMKAVDLVLLERYGEAVEFIDKSVDAPDIMATKLFSKDKAHKKRETVEKIELMATKGYALLKMDYNEEAVRVFDRALKYTPEISELWAWKAEALRKMERNEEAAECELKAQLLKKAAEKAAEKEKDAAGPNI
jgi:tetratricopeptide (TPR) repeat protein